jgi:hypothetical protein
VKARVLAAAVALTAGAAGARAQPAGFPVEIVAAVAPEGGKGGPVLVGRSGQLYAPGADRVWRRKGAGGVARDVVAALRSPTRPAEVIAVGDEAPAFRFTGAAWKADIVGNRGAAALSRGGGVPALAVGRHVYTLEKEAWVRRTSVARTATAVWAASPTAILIATSDGALARWDGKRLAPIKTGLPAADPIALLLGAQPRQVFARSKSGRWLRISGTSAAAVAIARELEGFDEHSAGIGEGGALLLAGTAGAAGARKSVIARAEQTKAVPWQDLAALADGDRFAAVFAAGGDLTVASRSGAVQVRAAAGGWSAGRVAGELPPAAAARARRSGPARSR